jgi:tRNA(adenine34) deaminase
MCAGAVVQARLPLVVYGCTDPKAGACETLYKIPTDPRLNHRATVLGGVLGERCAAVLTDFFQARRLEGRK